MAVCLGNTKDSCCYIEGELCRFLRDDGVSASRRWVCTLREEHGNWSDVHNDERYITQVRPHWIERGIADCGDYKCENCIDGNT